MSTAVRVEPDFWDRCVAAGCVIVPVGVYSKYGDDGNTHDEDSQGIRYAALPLTDSPVGPDYWFMIDESQEGYDLLYESPEAALTAFIAKQRMYKWS